MFSMTFDNRSFFQAAIHAQSLNGENRTAVAPGLYLGSVQAIALDWAARNLYWLSVTPSSIGVIQLDGQVSYSKVLPNVRGDTAVGSPVSACIIPSLG